MEGDSFTFEEQSPVAQPSDQPSQATHALLSHEHGGTNDLRLNASGDGIGK